VPEAAHRLAKAVRREAEHLARQDFKALAAGRVSFLGAERALGQE
jgi:hypothetical protein